MPEIRVLDQSTINQIAAGEVVERPSSIVKELVENAVDANSTAITVEIKGGGIDFIRITDNGCGIEKEQVRKAFLPHATSKIRSASDLETVTSLGFRGEALSSIASVAKVELVTKTDEGISGIRYVIEGGKEKSYDEIGCPEGTTFIIRNLFFNTPARRKFLKSKMTEAGYVESFIQRLALSHPDISFKFICDNKNKISTSGNGNLKDVIYNIFGRDVAMNLLPVKGNENGILVDGYVGKPVISRGNRNYENYFVNGRYLKNNIISKAIEEGYKGHAMVHKFPFTALMISMDPHCFDANVHPAKMEMRFRNAEELYSSVMSAVRGSFVKKELIPKVGIGNDKKAKESVKKIPEPFERKRRAIEERFSSENMAGSVGAYADTHGENSENITEILNRRGSIEERIARLHIGENNAIKKEIDDVIPKSMNLQTNLENQQLSEQKEFPQEGDKKEIFEEGAVAGVENTSTKMDISQNQEEKVLRNQNQEVQTLQENEAKNSFKNIPDSEKNHSELLKEADTYGRGIQMSFADVPLLSEEARPKHRIIGQVFRTYWLVEFDEKLFFVDQHAAHEKVMYEKLKKDLKNNMIAQQIVAPPVILTFSIKEQQKFKVCEESFKKLGFLIEEFGGNEYCIRGVPANLLGIDPQELFIEIFDQIEESSGKMNLEVITDKLATMACKAAVKGNTTMSYQEMDALLDQLMKLDNPYQCPHGRPTIISMTKYELEKKFKRVQ
nr:DNA mismatch repair endonuclease MutL [uncultured Anaerobutyricum sp.]